MRFLIDMLVVLILKSFTKWRKIMQILQPVLDLWPSLSSFVSTLEMLSMPFLLMFASSIITISTYLCKILRLLMNLSVALVTRVKKMLSKQPHSHPKTQQEILRLERQLQALLQEFKLTEETKTNEQSGLFKIQR